MIPFNLQSTDQVRVGDVIAKHDGSYPLTITKVMGEAIHSPTSIHTSGLDYGVAVEVAERNPKTSNTVLWYGPHTYLHRANWSICAICEQDFRGIDYLCGTCRG